MPAPKPPTPPDSEVKALAQRYADRGVPPILAVKKALDELTVKYRTASRSEATRKALAQNIEASRRIGVPTHWLV